MVTAIHSFIVNFKKLISEIEVKHDPPSLTPYFNPIDEIASG